MENKKELQEKILQGEYKCAGIDMDEIDLVQCDGCREMVHTKNLTHYSRDLVDWFCDECALKF